MSDDTVFPPDGESNQELANRIQFPCPHCGARLNWDPDADALACEHCGHKSLVPRVEERIEERPLAAAGLAARGLGSERRSVRCGNCGAILALAESLTSDSCAFCGSANVLAQESNRNLIRPESLIPLDVSRANVERNVRAWIDSLWFRPNALRRVRNFAATGVYVPYWTFDSRAHSRWSADAGYYYYETVMTPVMVNGRMQMRPRRVQRVRWVPAWGQRDDVFDDMLIHASRGISEELARQLGGFDTSALIPYRPEYLAGHRAEEYQIDLEQGWSIARDRMVAEQRRRCSTDVPGDTHRNLRVQTDLADARWKHVLLPIWSLSYDFGGRRYSILVHGQTGRVHGHAPYSWAKIALFVACVLAVTALVAFAILIANSA